MRTEAIKLMIFIWFYSIFSFGIIYTMEEKNIEKNSSKFIEIPTSPINNFHMDLGCFKVTVLCDGYIDLNLNILISNDSLETKNFLKNHCCNKIVQISINIFLIKTDSKLILVDTGLAAMYNSTTGLLLERLKTAGYSPEDIDVVLITHLHPDHMAGLLTKYESRTFTNATIYLAKAELDFWTNEQEEKKASEDNQPVFSLARKILEPYKSQGKVYCFERTEQLFSGVTAVLAEGHTPGHSGFMFESNNQKLFIIGDVIHSHDIQFSYPKITIEYDIDQMKAVETRLNIFTQVAAEHTLVGGAHLPFPGLGYIIISNGLQHESYSWMPLKLKS